MDDKKILIIGEESKHVGLAHSLKRYYSNVCTRKADKDIISEYLKNTKYDVVIAPIRIEGTDIFTFFDNLKSSLFFFPKIILIYPYNSTVIDVIARQFGFLTLKEGSFSITEIISTIEKDAPIVENKKDILSTPKLTEEERRKRIYLKATELINKSGIPTNIKGYYYLRDAVILCVENQNGCLISYTKCLCPEIAQKHGATQSSIDRSIRHAINVAWNTSSYIHDNMKHKPTSFQLITTFADSIRTSYME